MSLLRPLIALACVALLQGALLASSTAPAPHALNQSYIYLRVDEAQLEGRVEINLEDLNRAIGTDFREDLTVTEDEVAARIDEIEAYLYERIAFEIGGQAISLERKGFGLYESVQRQFVSCRFDMAYDGGIPDAITVTHSVMFETDPEHRGYLVIEHYFGQGTFNNEGNVSLVFKPDAETQVLDLTGASWWKGFRAIIDEGIHHILIGHDHILFVIVLLLTSVLRREEKLWEPRERFAGALKEVLKIVTVFTVAHSITLSIAALGLVTIPAAFIESVIALSIAVAAFDVIFPIFHRRLVLIVGLFGLFHGFGFANVLEPLKVEGSDLAYSLFGFNVGVEIGQVMIVLLAFPMLFMMRLSRLYTRFSVYAGAALSMFVALYWFTERAFDVDLQLGSALQSILGIL